MFTIGLAVDFSSGGDHAEPGDEPTAPPIPDDDPPSTMPGAVSEVTGGANPQPETDGGARVTGDESADFLMGGDGDDTLIGWGDADDLRGGQGADNIYGGDGDDWVQGEGDYGAGGDDEIHGGDGNDSLAGQGGHDLIWGDDGNDTLLGGEGDDTQFGGRGTDWLSGNDGDDVLVSGGGADDLDGGDGDDQLVGHGDAQTVFLRGGDGNDTLMPGAGDFAEGLQGNDRFVLGHTGGEIPIIADFDAREDQIVLHLPEKIVDDVQLDLRQDADGTSVLTVNGEPIGRLLQAGDLKTTDIIIERLPG
ncbi:calcium-binding protein [Paracoccus sp. 11-3]|uniref:Calcium-binding protein n=1 Tax=Paracoccus amoyensis TaxID=2760093 RepID=A0A926JAT3_9RHOB|nr:calcium-binding protein [Paracoccus amoyensis]